MTLNHIRISRRFRSSAPSDSDALSALVPAAFAPRRFTSLRRCRDGHGSIFLHETQPNPSHVLENATQPNQPKPIALENLGVFSSTTLDFISELGRRICVVRETSYLFQRISVMLQRFNSVLLHDTLPVDLPDL